MPTVVTEGHFANGGCAIPGELQNNHIEAEPNQTGTVVLHQGCSTAMQFPGDSLIESSYASISFFANMNFDHPNLAKNSLSVGLQIR